MDISKAKRFVYHDFGNPEKIYISNTIQPIIDINEHLLSTYAVIDTESGEKMMKVEYAYDGEPIVIGGILGTFLHYDYYIKAYPYIDKIYLGNNYLEEYLRELAFYVVAFEYISQQVFDAILILMFLYYFLNCQLCKEED